MELDTELGLGEGELSPAGPLAVSRAGGGGQRGQGMSWAMI